MDVVSDYECSDQNHKNDPSPTNFDVFLPWACSQLQVEKTIHITRTEQGTYSSPFAATDKKGRKLMKSKGNATETSDEKASAASAEFGAETEDEVIHIQTVYDPNGYLVQLKFLRNQIVPRKILKLISFIIQFHPRLTAININRGLTAGSLLELSKMVSLSKVTEVILDNTVCPEANYYILLDKNSLLKYLSLARCKLNDKAVKTIASKLLSSSLSILNLTSNRITDEGATYLGNTLRSNRSLSYLNLSGNMITDIGAASILNCLMEFPLNSDEVTEKKTRYTSYLKNKHGLITKIIDEMRRVEAVEKNISKKKSIKLTPTMTKKYKGTEKENSVRTLLASLPNFDLILFEKAEAKAISMLGPFKDPFSAKNTISRDGVMYCLGNNTLSYLNLAYNNLTYFSVKKLFDVISKQEYSERTPRGLINVSIEGNNIPTACYELTEIDYMLQSGLASQKASGEFKRKSVRKR